MSNGRIITEQQKDAFGNPTARQLPKQSSALPKKQLGAQSLPVRTEVKNRPPNFLNVDGNLLENWISWKKSYLDFFRGQDSHEFYHKNAGKYFSQFLGPKGEQNILQHLIFDCPSDKEDLDKLMLKIDAFFVFGLVKKLPSETVEDYVENLSKIAKSCPYYDNTEEILKEKLLSDVKSQHFNGTRKKFMRFPLSTKSPLETIVDFWKKLERSNSNTIERSSTNVLDSQPGGAITPTDTCLKCGTNHKANKCPAYGKECTKCKKMNHFSQCCKMVYVIKCSKCGTDHFSSQCPAFGKTCSKCFKPNHFASKCQVTLVENCSRCGKDHIASVAACPAQGKICGLCKKPNHLEEKCTRR